MKKSFENLMLDLSYKQRKILNNGEKLLKKKRINLDIEKFYDLDSLVDPKLRLDALPTIDEYEKQLLVEKNFYTEYHLSFINEVIDISSVLSTHEKERILTKCLLGLEENNKTRISINEKKTIQNQMIRRIVEIFNENNVTPSSESITLENDDDIIEIEKIFEDLETLSIDLEELSDKQKKKEIEGKNFIGKFLDFLRKNH